MSELLSHRQLLGALARADLAQEPAQVRRPARNAGERRDRETGDERGTVARSHADWPLALIPGVRVVDAPAKHARIDLVYEQREGLTQEEPARDSEQLGGSGVGLEDDPGSVGDDEPVRAVAEDLARCGDLELVPPRFGPLAASRSARRPSAAAIRPASACSNVSRSSPSIPGFPLRRAGTHARRSSGALRRARSVVAPSRKLAVPGIRDWAAGPLRSGG